MSGTFPTYITTFDSWLSSIIGKPVWYVVERSNGIALHELKFETPGLFCSKCDVQEIKKVSALTNKGFHIVDTNLTFEANAKHFASEKKDYIRHAIDSDRESIMQLAGEVFQFSRFHLDPLILKEIANKIKFLWAGNFFNGQRGDYMFLAEIEGRIAGFIQIIWGNAGRMIIDLIGVALNFRGHGVGRALMEYAAHFGIENTNSQLMVQVGTQVANVPALRLYEALGMKIRSGKYILHYHC